MTASLTTPTLCVLVIITGPSKKPDSSTHVVPVISPLPLRDHQPANTGLLIESFPRGRIAVTPVRIGPLPIWSFPSPEMRVVWPTVMPGMSVMALSGPGVPSKGTPRSRARGFATGFSWACRVEPRKEMTTNATMAWRELFRMNSALLMIEGKKRRNEKDYVHRKRRRVQVGKTFCRAECSALAINTHSCDAVEKGGGSKMWSPLTPLAQPCVG